MTGEENKHIRTLAEVSWNNRFIWPDDLATAAGCLRIVFWLMGIGVGSCGG